MVLLFMWSMAIFRLNSQYCMFLKYGNTLIALLLLGLLYTNLFP
jgi:hypothetical protein